MDTIKVGNRGIGMDSISEGCFICGNQRFNGSSEMACMNNISLFVDCKEDAEKIVNMFNGKVRLDYRTNEPDRIQVKIGACENHIAQLLDLSKRISKSKNMNPNHLIDLNDILPTTVTMVLRLKEKDKYDVLSKVNGYCCNTSYFIEKPEQLENDIIQYTIKVSNTNTASGMLGSVLESYKRKCELISYISE